MSDTYHRPRQLLDRVSRHYPDAWKQVEAFRANRRELGNWPSWCFMPLALAEKIIGEGSPALSLEQFKLVTFVGALAAWRSTQGIYRFDPSTFDALWKTPVTGDIPTDVLYCLPEWCVYIPTPDKIWIGNRLNGFFAHLDYNARMRRTELRLLLDISLPDGILQTVALPIIMGKGGVAGSLAVTLQYCAGPIPSPPN